MPQTPHIAFIGAGNMAQAILKGMLAAGYPQSKISASGRTQSKLDVLAADTGIHTSTDNLALCHQADVIVLGVKPHMMGDLVQSIAPAVDVSRQLIVSVAAGILANSIEIWLGKKVPIVRCMPNTPSLVGQGAAGLFATDRVSPTQKQTASTIMQSVGLALWVETEAHIDAVTAVSGSGPAYYFLMMEAMIAGAEKLGLTNDVAQQLVLQTAAGAAQMAQQSQQTPAQLRVAVTSPNGTTEQAINTFNDGDFSQLCSQAMTAAHHRSKELAQLFKA
ncbi:pyrroline-5-carboxylate reductase [Candidatus Njordibacter sp. Uisw_039]|jgi:pyrroline-5-carboxylate reductase|uniref:pyrroline-5-carboxylate reductase n=1 Tax=Candidatus Njordibacter sp. Uisw_039 TaxID=3230972 RepID=UPI003A3BC022|tara:strand:- start:869 stop:1696 length:828 start_codon:yes stop_codon:yes gene_type:complete